MKSRSAAYGVWIPKFAISILYSLLISYGSGASDHVDSPRSKVGTCAPNCIGCLPCSCEYLTASYFKNHNFIIDSDFNAFLAVEIGSNDSCKGLDDSILAVGLSDVFRHLSGEGSHRQLVSTIKFNVRSDVLSWLDDHFCELVIVERLPVGVFADPFELQHLVQRRQYLDAAVFGDTNLELPSALSNRSIVEMHIRIGQDAASNFSETVVRLPLHARYPPLDTDGYAEVIINKPDLFLRCRPKDSHDEACAWTVSSLDAESANKLMWRIPCGNKALAGIVSGVTFIFSLFCSLLIVYAALCFPKNYKDKES